MARDNNTLILFFLVGLIVVFGIYCVWGRSTNNETYADSKKMRDEPQTEILQKADVEQDEQDFQLLGVADEQPAFEIGFGMGPGLYGSGRHTSQMYGN